VRALLAALEARHPGLGEHVRESMAIAIDGEIHQDALGEPLAADAEVVLIPRIGGG
jgi:molybdopterin converting factor small subunit